MGTDKRNKTVKKVVKEVKKSTMSGSVKILILLSLFFNGILFYVIYENKNVINLPFLKPQPTLNISEKNWNFSDKSCDRLTVKYLNLEQMGDSIFIQCDNFDLLIDAGEKGDGSKIVLPEIESSVKDGILDLVVVTHMDSDHYAGMVGLKGQRGVLDTHLKILNFIDYGHRDDFEKTDYEVKRDEKLQQSKGTYCPVQKTFEENSPCFNQVKMGNNFKLQFLNTGYYDISGADKNEKSIAFTITYQNYQFFFAGDIFVKQEKQLLLNYPDLKNIDFYKASHHGSVTSNGNEILDRFQPNYIFLNCIEDNKHGIPQKERLSELKNYADGNIYVTGLNGTISVICDTQGYEVKFSENDLKFKDTDWFERILK